MAEEKPLVKADFVAALVLIAVSLFFIVNSVIMPKFEEWGLYATPGLPPLAFASIMLVLSSVLLVRSLRRGGHRIRLTREQVRAAAALPAVRRIALLLGLTIAYYLLLGRVHFALISAALVFAVIRFFGRTRWWAALIVAAAASFSIWFVFTVIFRVPLP